MLKLNKMTDWKLVHLTKRGLLLKTPRHIKVKIRLITKNLYYRTRGTGLKI